MFCGKDEMATVAKRLGDVEDHAMYGRVDELEVVLNWLAVEKCKSTVIGEIHCQRPR
jgi:hypothetical protein